MLRVANPELNSGALENVTECIKSGWISSQGHFVRDFEGAFAKYLECDYAIATSSGTASLHLALAALEIEGEVLVPSFTFIATANPIKYVGATPVFCDVDPNTWCIDVTDAWKKVTNKTRAIVVVHINGYPANMLGILEIACEHGLYVIEDACQALGTKWSNRFAGNVGRIGCFSFFANKHLTTGEGGMVTTNDSRLTEKVKILRDHGRTHPVAYEHDVIGFNYRMTNLQAAVGISQLDDLSEEVKRRRGLNTKYIEALGGTQTPNIRGWSPWLYHYKLPSAEAVTRAINSLRDADIEAKPFYKPIHLQEPYKNSNAPLQVTESLFGIMLPLHKGVTDEHIETMRRVLQ